MATHYRISDSSSQMDTALLKIPALAAELCASIIRVPLLAAQLAFSIVAIPLVMAMIGTGLVVQASERLDVYLEGTVSSNSAGGVVGTINSPQARRLGDDAWRPRAPVEQERPEPTVRSVA